MLPALHDRTAAFKGYSFDAYEIYYFHYFLPVKFSPTLFSYTCWFTSIFDKSCYACCNLRVKMQISTCDSLFPLNAVIMSAMASQITSLAIVNSIVYSGADQRKHQSSASMAFKRGIHRWPVNSPRKGPVTRKMFPYDDVILLTTPVDVWHLIHPRGH